MTVVAHRPPAIEDLTSAQQHRRPDSIKLIEIAAVAVGAGMSFMVARDGSVIWQIARLVAVIAITLVVLKMLRGRHALLGAIVALVGGAVAVPVGIGIAVPYVAKTGVSVTAVAGVAVVVGALILLVGGTRRLFCSLRPRWALPATGVTMIALILLSLTLGQAVAATNVPRPQLKDTTPADVGLSYRDVEFAATDGVTLSGWYLPSLNGAAVVVLHGAGSTRSNVLDHAAVLSRHGYGVLLFDARGHGDSDGRAMDFGWFGDEDLGGAVAFLNDQPDVDPARIAAVGLSMGGEEAIGAAASMTSIRAVVAEGATNRVAGDKAWLSEEFGLRGQLSEGVERLTYGFADLLTSGSPPITLRDAVRGTAPRPVLLIAAGDVPDEQRAARFIQRSSPDTVELWVAPDSGHTQSLHARPEEWEARVVGFLDKALAVIASGSRR